MSLVVDRSEVLAGARAIAPLLLGVAPFGLLFGALAVRLEFGIAAAIGASLLMFAGAAQFVFVQLAASGASWPVVVLACLVVNLRHVLYSASLAPGVSQARTAVRAVLAYFLTDEAYAITSRHAAHHAGAQHSFFLGAGVTLWLCWQLSTIAGAIVGARLPPSPLYAFTLPVTFVAIVAPTLRDRAAIACAIVAGGLGIASAALPLGTGLIVASAAAIAAGGILERDRT